MTRRYRVERPVFRGRAAPAALVVGIVRVEIRLVPDFPLGDVVVKTV